MKEHRIGVRLILAIFVALHVVFALELLIDLHRAAGPRGLTVAELWRALDGSAAMARGSGTTISRAYNVLVSMVLMTISLAIPLTANMYTPKLIEIFIRDKVNVVVLSFFVISSANALWSTQATWDQGPLRDVGGVYPRIALWVSFEAITLGWATIIPYFYYVFRFLNPDNIIARIEAQIVQELDELRDGRKPLPEARDELAQNVLHLGNVALRAIDRADRDVTVDAIKALERVILEYHRRKGGLDAAWFRTEPEPFLGLSKDAIAILHEERIWFEHLALSQLSLAYQASLAKMQDAVSAIAKVNREIAESAVAHRDMACTRLHVRFFNTFVREAIKKKDVHAIYDLFYQYREMARDLLSDHPGLSLEIARHFKYYAEFARMSGIAFIYELTAYELESLLESAYDREAAGRREVLDLLLAFDAAQASVRLTKAKAIAGAYLDGRGLSAEAGLLRAQLRAAPAALLQQARGDLLGTTDPVFWEVTDRQTNLDYVAPERRRAVEGFFASLGPAPAVAEAPRP